MQIVVNHLTRMHGGHICVAGVDQETGRHVRPVPQHGGLSAEWLARHGGPFEMAGVVDLGSPRAVLGKPHCEDYILIAACTKLCQRLDPHEFWNLLYRVQKASLREIFGSELRAIGNQHLVTDLGKGTASLGCLRSRDRPQLYLATTGRRKPRIRMRFSDGQLRADAGVTDLRLYQADHATPDPDLVRGVAKWIADSEDVILGVGLTRKYRVSEQADYFHWLQVNNIHLKEDPTWQLG